ncbi:MAG: sulfatase-like hydrolase/transferase [Bacteroidetes bacterium]|nr:sulfatase-like hydrolase/transferase [Bacteroidota bacterium]
MNEITLDLGKERPFSGILPKQLTYVLRTYLTGLLCFTVFRLILVLQEFHQLHFIPTEIGIVLVLKAFLLGLRFDTVVLGYILTLPFLLLAADAFTGWNSRLLYRIVFGLVTLGAVVSFFICAADLPFFHHFYSRVSMSILNSADAGDSKDMLGGMVLQEWRYTWAFIPFIIISWFFYNRHKRLLNNVLYKKNDATLAGAIRWFVVFAMLLSFGIWGRFSLQSHLDASTAYFSDYGFTNMLALNPAYTFGLSYVNSKTDTKDVRFMGDGEAVRNVQKSFNIPAAQEYNSPIARQVMFADSSASHSKPNVVLVIMESMSAGKMGRYGNRNDLTPFMDSLATQSYAFDSVFTAGIHTFAGIYSSLFSQPVVRRRHPLEKIIPQSGIANTLKAHDYSTIYFTTHDKGFDNVGAYLMANGYDRIVSKDDYPPEKVLSALGVPDDYLYQHAVGDLDALHDKGQPFFAAIMTGSDHGPFIIPKNFKPKHKDAMLGVVEYVDWSVRKFLRMASERAWFDNTIFVFVADHGTSLDKRYDMPLSYLHSPLIFYAPKILGPPQQFNTLGSQADIFPTLMGMLKLPYVNNTFGIDLFAEKRPFATAYADDKFAVLNSEYMYVSRENGVTSLYHYRTGDVKDYSKTLPELTAQMKLYGESTFQAAQWLRKNGMTGMQTLQ